MPPKCFTKTANDGHSYTTCIDEKKTKPKPKFKINKRTPAPAPAPAPAPVVKKKKIVIRKQEGPRNLKKGFGIRSGAPTVQAPAKAAPSQLTKMTGLPRADANKMDPAQLFGMLPTELRKTVLTSGTKVGRMSKADVIKSLEEIYRIPFPRGKIGSGNADRYINRLAKYVVVIASDKRLKKGSNYRNTNWEDLPGLAKALEKARTRVTARVKFLKENSSWGDKGGRNLAPQHVDVLPIGA